MQYVKDILGQFRVKLSHCYDENELESVIQLVFEHVLGFKRSDLVLKSEEWIPAHKQDYFNHLLNDLQSGMPVQYVIGHSWFLGLKFYVNPAVLIPRPETEELVRWIINEHQSKKDKPLRVFDFCSGSGCIAISLAKSYSSWKIFGIELSDAALEVARRNNSLNETGVVFLKGDLLKWETDPFVITTIQFPEEKADILICNPPYIKYSDKSSIHSRVKDFEPELALFVPDDDPIIFYRKLAELGLQILAPGSNLYIEIHRDCADEICRLLREKGYSSVLVKKDLQSNDRMISACFIP